MKKSYLTSICGIAMIMAIMLGISCQTSVPEINLPATQTITCKAGDKPSLTFNAEAAWRLSSDALWCKFITPNGELQEVAGEAGTPTVTLKISDANISSSTTIANITITMAGKSGILATVERGAKELYIKLYNADGKETNHIELGYDEYIATNIEANFSFAAINIPEWIEVAERDDNDLITVTNSIVGDSGERVEVLLRIVNDGVRETNKISIEDNKFLNFVDEKQSVSFEFPITYSGMGDRNLTFAGPTANYYGWEVSLDGKTFSQYNEVDQTTTTLSEELTYRITAQDNDYAVILLEQHIERGIPSFEYFADGDSDSWVSFNKERMALTVMAHQGKPRYGVVMALPRGIYNEVNNDVSLLLEEDISSGIALPCVKSDYSKYILIDFVQHDMETTDFEGMYAYHSLTTLEIFCEPYADSELTAMYGVDDLFICDFVNPVEGKIPGVIIDPRIEEWTILSHEAGIASVELWYGERQMKISDGEFYVGENKDEVLSVHLWGPKDGWNECNVHILFKVDNQIKKVLVVTPPSI